MNQLEEILRKWRMSEKTIQNFKDKRVRMDQLLKLTSDHIKELIPEFDDRLDFIDRLEEHKNESNLNGGSAGGITITVDSIGTNSPSEGTLIAQRSLDAPETVYAESANLVGAIQLESSANNHTSNEPPLKLRKLMPENTMGQLESLIRSSNDGICVLSLYKKEKRLTETQRNTIGDIIIFEVNTQM